MTWCAVILESGTLPRPVLSLGEFDQSLIDMFPAQIIPIPNGTPVVVGWLWSGTAFSAPPPDYNAIRATKLNFLQLGFQAAMASKSYNSLNYPATEKDIGLLAGVITARKKKLADSEETPNATVRWPMLDLTGQGLTIANMEELLVVLVNHRQACADEFIDRVGALKTAYDNLNATAMEAVPTDNWPT